MSEVWQYPAIVNLDECASEAHKPYGVITADCESPREIDDAVFVQPLPSASEAYRVGVCIADTSKLYDDIQVRRAVINHPRAEYGVGPNGNHTYRPMIDPRYIKRRELKRTPRGSKLCSALIVSFVVGDGHPPDQTDIGFGTIEVQRNHTYKKFGNKCRYSDDYDRYGRASAFIMSHLQYVSADMGRRRRPESAESIHRRLMHVPSARAWERGSAINEAFMIAANYLTGKTLAEEADRLAIYRVHDPADVSVQDFLPPTLGRYSLKPGEHAGLGLSHYCRVTSPLRRGEDFVMSHLLRERFERRRVTGSDVRVATATVQRLNQLIMSGLLAEPPRLAAGELWGSPSGPGARQNYATAA